jgi:phage I-like protein
MIHLFRVIKRGDKWIVQDEAGTKDLGEHNTKEEAEAQLRAIEAHKHMSKFSVNAWCFALGPPQTGKWDRFTSWGVKVKDGEESTFNETNLGQMVENFANRKNDIAMCYDHQSAFVAENGQPAPALAFYNALALVVDGQLAKFATHDPSVSAPDVSGLENGVYGYRSEVTELGQKLLPNYKYLSPMFTDKGLDETGNSIGYDLMDVAATNVPFQDGVGLTFHRGIIAPQKERYSMDPEMMKRLGLADDASGDEVKGAMAAHLAKYFAAEDEAKKMAEDEAKKMAAEEDKPAADEKQHAEPDADDKKMAEEPDADDKKMAKDDSDADEDDMKKMSKALGLTGDPSARAIRYAVEAQMIAVRNAVADRTELEKLRAEALATREQGLNLEAEGFANEAISGGQWPEEKRANLLSLYKKSVDDAKAVLFKKGEFTHVRKNFSKQLETRTSPQMLGGDFGAQAQAYAKAEKVPLHVAQQAVAKKFPDLYKTYKSGE